MRRSLAVSALAATIVGLGASPAWADDPGDGFEPVPPEYYDPIDFQACGQDLTLVSGDVREVEVRETTQEDGSLLTEFRGGATVDIVDASGTVLIDELDISGPMTIETSADGTSETVVVYGESILYQLPDPIDQAAFEEAGLPDLGYFTDADETVTFEVTLDPATGAFVSEQIHVDADIVNLCNWLDGDRDDEDDDDDKDDDD